MRASPLATAVLALGAAAVAGCDAASGAGARPEGDAAPEAAPPLVCPLPGSTEGPPVSFTADLMPLFAVNCAFLGCHDGFSRVVGLYLGRSYTEGESTAAEIAEVYASLLGPSTMAPERTRVVPGDPLASFAMLKLDGCQNAMGFTCTGGVREAPCGARMPAQSDELPLADRDRIRRWIAQGAPGP